MVSALIVRAQILEGTWKVALNRQGLTTFSFNIFQPLEINFLLIFLSDLEICEQIKISSNYRSF